MDLRLRESLATMPRDLWWASVSPCGRYAYLRVWGYKRPDPTAYQGTLWYPTVLKMALCQFPNPLFGLDDLEYLGLIEAYDREVRPIVEKELEAGISPTR